MRSCLKYLIAILFGLTLCVGSVLAAETQDIELTNGSVISGEIVSLDKGIYTVKTDTLGTLYIQQYKIRSIRKKGAASQDTGDQIKSVQKKMTGTEK